MINSITRSWPRLSSFLKQICEDFGYTGDDLFFRPDSTYPLYCFSDLLVPISRHLLSIPSLKVLVSQATPFAERGRSGHVATIELSPLQKLVLTNQIRALRRSHPLSWSYNYVTSLADVSILLPNRISQ